MTQIQRIIKTCATVLAIVLAVAIIGGIVRVVTGLSFAVDLFSEQEDVSTTEIITTFDEKEITALEIDLATARLCIETGERLQVSNDKNEIAVKQNGTTIVVEEEEHPFWKESGTVTLTVPSGYCFSYAEIDTGAGKIEAESFYVKELDLSLGAGEAVFEQLSVSGNADVETGAGKLTIESGAIGKLDMELGVGKAEITSSLGNGSRVECGVGALELNLTGGKDVYGISARTGVGQFTVDGKVVTDNTTIGNGAAVVTVEGGVGTVKVAFVA